MVNVKVVTDKGSDRQTDGQTGQKLYVPDLSMRGHRNVFIHQEITLTATIAAII